MLESRIENRLKLRVERLGGLCLKFCSPGKAGAPDRIVLIGGKTYFVETKAPGGVCSPLQLAYHKELRAHGFDVFVIFRLEQIDNFIDYGIRTA